MPQLRDPNFVRSVVLMLEHGSAGSFGLVLNRPTDTRVADVLEVLNLPWMGDPEATVWSGGPVTPQSGWVLHAPCAGEGAPGLEGVPGIQLSTTPDQLKALALRPPARLRFLMGYAGWGPGQLEGELAAGAWVLAEGDADLVFETPPDRLWEAALHSLGVEPASLAPGSGIH